MLSIEFFGELSAGLRFPPLISHEETAPSRQSRQKRPPTPPSATFAVIPLIIERIHFFKVESAGRGTYYVLTHKQDINRA